MKINLNFIPQNTAPKGATKIAIYNSEEEKVGTIPLGNLALKANSDKLYTFGALSDVHLPYSTGPEDFIKALNFFNNTENVDFVCISGDMGSTGVDSEWANFKTHVDTYSPNTPVYISAGNHDAGQSANKTHEYPITYTGNPLYYSFTQGDDVFIMFGMTFWGNPPFSNESLQWLYETLEENRNKRCFVFQHMMRQGYAGDASGRYSWDGLNNTNGKVFLSLMEHYKNVLWFHGHSHCEFEQQDTLDFPNSNYDRAFGCHSIHVPSCCMTRNEDNGYDYEDSEGYVVDVYENGVHLRGRDFIAEKFLPIASYWIDTTPTTITANSYKDSTGTINTGSSTLPGEITLPEGSTYTLNVRESYTSKSTTSEVGMLLCQIPCEPNTKYKLIINNKIPLNTPSQGGKYSTIFGYDKNKTNAYILTGSVTLREMTSEYITFENEKANATITFTTAEDVHFIMLSLVISDTDAITENDLNGVAISLKNNGGIILPEGSELYIAQKYSGSSGALQDLAYTIAVFIPLEYEANTTYKLKVENLPTPNLITDGTISTLYAIDASKTKLGNVTGSYYQLSNMTSNYITLNEDETSFVIKCTPVSGMTHLALTLRINYTETVTEDDLKGVVISLENESTVIVGPAVNIVPTLLDTDLTNVYNGIGYKENARINSSGGVTDLEASYKTTLTGLIPLEKDGDVLHVRGVDRVTYIDGRHVAWLSLWDSTGAFLEYHILFPEAAVGTDENGDFTMVLDYEVLTINNYPTASFIRLQLGEVTDKLIITRNQLINESGITYPENSELYLNQRYSQSSGGLVDGDGFFTLIMPIENNTNYVLNVKNNPYTINLSETNVIYTLKSDKTYYSFINGSNNIGSMTSGVTFSNNGCDVEVKIPASSTAKYIVLSICTVDSNEATAITEDFIKNVIVTLAKNVLSLAVDANGNDFVGANGENGYKTGYRLRTTGAESAQENACVTGFIPCDDIYAKIRMKNYTLYYPDQQDTLVDRIAYYNSNKELVLQHAIFTSVSGVENDGEVLIIKPYVQIAEMAYFRISTGVINEDTIITIDEEI